jgi:hypothetical protein
MILQIYIDAYVLSSTKFLLDEPGPLGEKTATELRLGTEFNKEHQKEIHHQIAKAQRGSKSIYTCIVS